MWGALEITLAVAVCVTLVAVVAACVCGCRKESQKSELVGTAGVVKLRFEEEIQPPTQVTPVSGKRVSSQNSQRSLPEIPPSVPSRQDSGDTASDTYATVGTNQRVSEQSSPITVRRSDHPYEHAYARLQDGSHRTEDVPVQNETLVNSSSPLISNSADENTSSPEAGIVITASNAISGQVSSSRDLPYMTPPVVSIAPVNNNLEEVVVQPGPTHFSGDSVDSAKGYTSISVREPLSSIRPNVATVRVPQPHYATVSDDSDEMYAAIDEPSNQVYTSGSETYAQIQPPVIQPLIHAAPNPAPAAVRPPNPQISPNAFVSNASNPSPEVSDVNIRVANTETPVATATVQKHTRQASTSSATGSVGPLGSPKPEKRQANSPLPPPPQPSTSEVPTNVVNVHKKSQESPVNHNKSSKHHKISSTGNLHDNDKLRRSLNEKHQRNNSCVSSSDFYGCNYPVDKHRFSSGDLVRPLVARELNISFDKPADKQSDAIYNTIDGTNDIYAAIDQEAPRKSLTLSQPNVTGSPIKNVEEMYAKVMKKSKMTAHSTPDHRSQSAARLSNYEENTVSKIQEQNSTSNVSRKKSSHSKEEKKRLSGSSPNASGILHDNKIVTAQALNKDDPGYETIDRIRNKGHGYETVTKSAGSQKSEKSDPGYETVKESSKNQKHKVIPTVSGGLMQHSHNSVDILQRITLHDGRASPINEPGYESVPSGPDSLLSNDPGYEHIRRSERYASDSEPNYEILRSRNSTPPYASIRNNKSQSAPGYSVINKKPKVPEHNWSNNNENVNEPNYESMPHENLYNTGSESDPNYESVGPKDPNYESVKYFDGSVKEPPYEKVKHNASSGSSNFKRTESSSSHDKVKSILKHDKRAEDKNDNKANGTALSYPENTPVADYFQV